MKDVPLNLIKKSIRLTPLDFQELLKSDPKLSLIDIRTPTEFDLLRLPFPAENIPLRSLIRNSESVSQNFKSKTVVFVCRRGNDSQKAVSEMQKVLGENSEISLFDIKGGLYAWQRDIDSSFPLY